MTYFDRPLPGKRTYIIEIGNKNNKKEITIKYEQAKLIDVTRFYQKVDKGEIIDRLKDFLEKYSNIIEVAEQIKEDYKIQEDTMTIALGMINSGATEIWNTINTTYFRGLFEELERKDGGQGTSEIEEVRETPFGATILTLANKDPLKAKQILETMTIEEYMYCMKNRLFAENEESEEGREINDKNLFSKKYTNEELLDQLENM